MLRVVTFKSKLNNNRQTQRTEPIPLSHHIHVASTSQQLTSAAAGSEAKAPWGALVTALADHVGFTRTLPPHCVTLAAEGALRITLTGWKHTGAKVSWEGR